MTYYSQLHGYLGVLPSRDVIRQATAATGVQLKTGSLLKEEDITDRYVRSNPTVLQMILAAGLTEAQARQFLDANLAPGGLLLDASGNERKDVTKDQVLAAVAKFKDPKTEKKSDNTKLAVAGSLVIGGLILAAAYKK